MLIKNEKMLTLDDCIGGNFVRSMINAFENIAPIKPYFINEFEVALSLISANEVLEKLNNSDVNIEVDNGVLKFLSDELTGKELSFEILDLLS